MGIKVEGMMMRGMRENSIRKKGEISRRNKVQWKGRVRSREMREKKRWRRKCGKREERTGEENHQRKERVESAIKRIKCPLCSQKTYGAPANSKSDAESIEVCIAKGSEEYSRFWETVPDLK